MNLFTEKEYINQNSHFAFRLRNLYQKNEREFYQIQEYLPSPIYINDRVSLKHHFFSKTFFSKGKEIENIYALDYGTSYLKKISNLALFKRAVHIAKKFHLENDYNSVCNYLQCISLDNKMTPYFTNKVLIDDKLTLNISMFPSDSELLGKVFQELIPFGEENLNKWLRFQTLTKREKEILKLIAHDHTTKDIAELLIISPHSVKTHRKNIYKKLDITKASQLVRIAIAMELVN